MSSRTDDRMANPRTPRRSEVVLGLHALLLACSAFAVLNAAGVRPGTEGGDRIQGQQLALELRSQMPPDNLSTAGVLKIRNDQNRQSEVPVRMRVLGGDTAWQSLYQAFDDQQNPVETLIVFHAHQQPTKYQYTTAARGPTQKAQTRTLGGDEAMLPFAGSDFWLSDLGLEFFHWPEQRVIKKEMRKGRTCFVLESAQLKPPPGQYSRVLSWIDSETGGLLRAEAYDQTGRLFKEFSIRSMKKVDGRWQLKEMEIRNDRTDARTRLEFDLQIDERR